MARETASRRVRTLKHICVSTRPGKRSLGVVRAGHLILPCALGRTGIAAFKREGDGVSPRGVFRFREAFYRRDRGFLRLPVGLRQRTLKEADGWCDAAGDRNYNRYVRHPYPASAERLWRNDQLYDAILVIGYNDLPRCQGAGSAIFLHLAIGDGDALRPTEGCVALRRKDLVRLLPMIGRQTEIRIGV